MTNNPPASSAKDQSRGVFEDLQFQALAVPTALEMFFRAIDDCRDMMAITERQELLSPSTRKEYEQLISSRDRRTLDTAIAEFWSEVIQKGSAELKRLGFVDDDAGADDVIYPLGDEAALTLESFVLQKIKSEIMQKHFAAYENDELKTQYVVTILRQGPPGTRTATIGFALLPFIVSAFEQYVASLLRTGLNIYPEALGKLKDVPFDVIRKYQRNIDSSDIVRWQIDQKVADVLRMSPDELEKTLSKWPSIELSTVGGDWDTIREMIQRRHAVTHNGGRVDAEYLSKVSLRFRHGLTLGSRLDCSSRYLEPALIELETLAVCLAERWAKKVFGDQAQYHPDAMGRVVTFESHGRWTQALALTDAVLAEPLATDRSTVALARINRWFCLQQLGRDDEALSREIRLWIPDEISEKPSEFRIAMGKLSLLREYDDLARSLKRSEGEKELLYQKKAYREMPLMARAMRESAAVRAVLTGTEPRTVRAGMAHRGKGSRRTRAKK